MDEFIKVVQTGSSLGCSDHTLVESVIKEYEPGKE